MKVKRKKGFKRIRQDVESDVEESQDQGDDREAIANQLFEGSDTEERERPARRDEVPEQYASEESDVDSETDDFIVDDEGHPITDKRKKRKPMFADAQLQEAQDIFGVDFDYDDLEREEEEDYDEEEDEDEDEYENEEQSARKTKKALRRKRKLKSLYELYEPHELARAGITEEDNKIRNTDGPERMQLRTVPVVPADEDELEEEAEWIFNLGFKNHKFAVSVEKSKDGISPGAASVAGSDWGAGGDDWEKQSNIVLPAPAESGITAVSQRQKSGEEDWETPAKSTTGVDEDGWETSSNWGQASAVGTKSTAGDAPPPPAAAGGGDDEGWDTNSNWGTSTVGAKSTAGGGGGDEDWDSTSNWGQASAIGAKDPAKSIIAEKSVIDVQEEVKPKVVAKIKKALEFMRNQHLEVPFIAFYRKEYIQPELKINDLWKIYKLDARFCQLRTRKNRLCTLFKNMLDYQTDLIMEKPDDPIADSMRLVTEDDIDRIKTLKTSEELKDMYILFSLYYTEDAQCMKDALAKKRREEKQRAKEAAAAAAAADGEELDEPIDVDIEPEAEGCMKRKIGGGAYSLCKKLGVDGLVKKFGLPPEKFAENLRDSYTRHEVEQYPLDPMETAKEYLTERLKNEDEALKAAKFMLATQISREPLVRSCSREVFFERATLTVYPTKKGLREIDEAHPCYG